MDPIQPEVRDELVPPLQPEVAGDPSIASKDSSTSNHQRRSLDRLSRLVDESFELSFGLAVDESLEMALSRSTSLSRESPGSPMDQGGPPSGGDGADCSPGEGEDRVFVVREPVRELEKRLQNQHGSLVELVGAPHHVVRTCTYVQTSSGRVFPDRGRRTYKHLQLVVFADRGRRDSICDSITSAAHVQRRCVHDRTSMNTTDLEEKR